jgi:hypothetical protein
MGMKFKLAARIHHFSSIPSRYHCYIYLFCLAFQKTSSVLLILSVAFLSPFHLFQVWSLMFPSSAYFGLNASKTVPTQSLTPQENTWWFTLKNLFPIVLDDLAILICRTLLCCIFLCEWPWFLVLFTPSLSPKLTQHYTTSHPDVFLQEQRTYHIFAPRTW